MVGNTWLELPARAEVLTAQLYISPLPSPSCPPALPSVPSLFFVWAISAITWWTPAGFFRPPCSPEKLPVIRQALCTHTDPISKFNIVPCWNSSALRAKKSMLSWWAKSLMDPVFLSLFLGSMSARVIMPLFSCAVLKTWTRHVLSARMVACHLLFPSPVSPFALKGIIDNLYSSRTSLRYSRYVYIYLGVILCLWQWLGN